MPSGRLTRQDRQYIAARLAEGTPYAEIARHLDRPTSTISREVNRNGGPRRYRPDQAQQATAARARRHPGSTRTAARETANAAGTHDTAAKPGTSGPATGAGTRDTGTTLDGGGGQRRDPQVVRRVVDDLTAMVAHTGLPPMASRVLTQLFTDDSGRLTAAELTDRLRVSPASISKAVADLERQGLLRRERDPCGRRDHYVVDDDVWVRAWLASTRMNLLLAETTQRAADILGTATPAGNRLRNTSQFLEHVTRDMTRAAEHWGKAFQSRT